MIKTYHPARPFTAVMLGFLSLFLPADQAIADAPCETGISKLRFQDDVACFRDPENRDGWLDQFKAIPLADTVWLSFGGEGRLRYEYTQNPAFGADPQDLNGVWMQRFTLHADLQLGQHVRFFAQTYHALEAGRSGGPSPVDENLFEFQNLFVDLTAPLGGAEITARLGRQEMAFGSGRLIDVREGPNNRRNFDAARLTLALPDWQIDGVIGRPVAPAPGVLDDQTNDEQWLWGVYATGGADLLPLGEMDIYYLGFRDDNGGFVQGTAVEERHSIGARFHGAQNGWDWNWEGVYQFGSFGQGDIRAWTVATITGFTFDAPWRPRIGLSMNVASGDDNPNDTDLGTFNPLFPRGNYFSEAAVLGPRNFFNVNPSVQISPTNGWSVAAGPNFFWRLNPADGVYTPSGQILRAPGGSSERYVGTGLSLSTAYEIAHGLEAGAIYTRVFAGEFLQATGPSEDIDFVELTLQYKF